MQLDIQKQHPSNDLQENVDAARPRKKVHIDSEHENNKECMERSHMTNNLSCEEESGQKTPPPSQYQNKT